MLPLQLRVDADSLPALIAGGLLLIAASAMGIWQWWSHRRLMQDSNVSESVYQITERQIRNRLIVAALLFLLGIAIPLGDQLDFFFRGRPGLFFAYWMGVLLLVLGMVVVVVADALATLAFARVSQVELRHERRELEEEIRRYRASKNGADAPSNESP